MSNQVPLCQRTALRYYPRKTATKRFPHVFDLVYRGVKAQNGSGRPSRNVGRHHTSSCDHAMAIPPQGHRILQHSPLALRLLFGL